MCNNSNSVLCRGRRDKTVIVILNWHNSSGAGLKNERRFYNCSDNILSHEYNLKPVTTA